MNPVALKIFCDVVQLQSFSDAAVENQMTQAAVSQNVMQLEKRLGIKLIDRTKRPFQLTEEGTVYYEGCKELVDQYFAIENEVKHLQGEVRGRVRVAAIYSAGLAEISRAVQQFTHSHPNCTVRLAFLHPHRVYESVLNDEADIGLVSYPRLRHELTSIPWRDEPMRVICAPDHPLMDELAVGASTGLHQEVCFEQLSGKALIGFDSDLRIRKEIDRFLRRHHVTVNVCMEFDNVETIKRAVEIGEGIAIVPEPTVAAEVQAGSLCMLNLPKPGLHRPLGIVCRKNRVFFRAADAFIEMIRSESGQQSDGRKAA